MSLLANQMQKSSVGSEDVAYRNEYHTTTDSPMLHKNFCDTQKLSHDRRVISEHTSS